MDIVKWDPFREMDDLFDRYNRFFGRPRRRSESGREILRTADWSPSVDITETSSEYLVKAELPEVKKEDVKISVDQRVLTIQGERRQEQEEKGKSFIA